MGSNIRKYLNQLEKRQRMPRNSSQVPNPGVFILEDGTAFMTPMEPLDYLIDHGTETPEGKRIVGYKLFPQQEEEFMSLILKMLVDDTIRDLNKPCQTRNL